jgi:prepilin-type N-terminal cleavage/methylation domain-containing protein
MKTRAKQETRDAFTLIEMMVVVAIIGILIAGVFRLLGAAGESNKKAVTIARIQKLQNALSGFYAEYGTYPPVTQHGSPDPFVEQSSEDGLEKHVSKLEAKNANRAAGCQPIGFEFPNVTSLDDFINTKYRSMGIMSVNQQLGQIAATLPKSDWKDVKIFKFGALSYLLPRIELMGGEDLVKKNENSTPDLNFFKSLQWTKNNSGSLAAQRTRENHAVGRWLPNFEKSLYGGFPLLGIATAEPDCDGPQFAGANEYPAGSKGGNKYVLVTITMRDGWGRNLYYYSAPPYQSYRIWSAGPNGNTFPPWIALDSLSSTDRKTATSWVEDDVVRFDH